tara:strand:+ start:1627 stop:1809 length:183 start_codon:yes stop_codon:yes gene_type:complete
MGVAISESAAVDPNPTLYATIRGTRRNRQDAEKPKSPNKATLMVEISIDRMFIAIAAINT